MSASQTPAPGSTGSQISPPTAPPGPNPQLLIEQYKAKLTDLGNLGTRQTSMTTYYVSIVSALFGVLAFKDRALKDIDPYVVSFISGAGILVSLLWLHAVSFFRNLFRAKIQVLEFLEQSLPFQTFSLEFRKMKDSGARSWLTVERFVPAVFLLFFVLLAVSRFCLAS